MDTWRLSRIEEELGRLEFHSGEMGPPGGRPSDYEYPDLNSKSCPGSRSGTLGRGSAAPMSTSMGSDEFPLPPPPDDQIYTKVIIKPAYRDTEEDRTREAVRQITGKYDSLGRLKGAKEAAAGGCHQGGPGHLSPPPADRHSMLPGGPRGSQTLPAGLRSPVQPHYLPPGSPGLSPPGYRPPPTPQSPSQCPPSYRPPPTPQSPTQGPPSYRPPPTPQSPTQGPPGYRPPPTPPSPTQCPAQCLPPPPAEMLQAAARYPPQDTPHPTGPQHLPTGPQHHRYPPDTPHPTGPQHHPTGPQHHRYPPDPPHHTGSQLHPTHPQYQPPGPHHLPSSPQNPQHLPMGPHPSSISPHPSPIPGPMAGNPPLDPPGEFYPHPARDTGPGPLTEQDVSQVEMFYRSHKSQVHVCQGLATLHLGAARSPVGSPSHCGPVAQHWTRYKAGIPVLVLDTGESRRQRKLHLLLAERGTGFALWKNLITHLTHYTAPHPAFHTMHLFNDHTKLAGLAFEDHATAAGFLQVMRALTSDPDDEVLNLSGMGRRKKAHKKDVKKSKQKYKAPTKADISSPCCFTHVTRLDRMDGQSLVGSVSLPCSPARQAPPLSPTPTHGRPDSMHPKS